MEPNHQNFESSTEHAVGDYWTNKPSAWPGTEPAHEQHRNSLSQLPAYSQYPNEDYDEELHIEEPVTRPGGSGSAVMAVPNEDVTPNMPTIPAAAEEAKDKQGLTDYTRSEIELQLATLIEYIRNKKLRPILWTCCSCSKEQKYRENLDPTDRLRCQYPRCGVSDRGFRIYRVHDMCDSCTVFVDSRAPVTKKALKKKRDEVREVLKKIKKMFEVVDGLLEFDEKEAAKMTEFVTQREVRDELDRERKEEKEMRRIERDRLRRDGWTAEKGDVNGDDSLSDYGEQEGDREEGDREEGDRGEEWEEEVEEAKIPARQQQGAGKPPKTRGFKGFLRSVSRL